MRLVCPACNAPFHPRDASAPTVACPNCGGAVNTTDPEPPVRTAIPVGRSRAVTGVAIIHLIYAAVNMCVAVSFAALVGEGRERPVGGTVAVGVVLGISALWLAVGIGLFMRWQIARYASFCLVAFTIVSTLTVGAPDNVCAIIFTFAVCGFVVAVLLKRGAEFR